MNALRFGSGPSAVAVLLSTLALGAPANAGGSVRVSIGVGGCYPPPVVYCPPPVCYPAPYPVYDPAPRVVYRDVDRAWRPHTRVIEEVTVIHTAPPSRHVEVVREVRPDPSARTLDRAWDRFEDACFGDAISLFQNVSDRRPGDGEPMAGAALAAALKGDDRSATWYMHQAFATDPRGTRIPADPGVASRARALQDRYEFRTERTQANRRSECKDPDEFFMLAATAYLVEDRPTARRAIERAIDLGDRSEGARNLRDLVCAEDHRRGDRR